MQQRTIQHRSLFITLTTAPDALRFWPDAILEQPMKKWTLKRDGATASWPEPVRGLAEKIPAELKMGACRDAPRQRLVRTGWYNAEATC